MRKKPMEFLCYIPCKFPPILMSWCMQLLAQTSKEVDFPHGLKNTAPVGGNAGGLLSFTTALLSSCCIVSQGKPPIFFLFLGNKDLRQPIIQQLNSLFDFITPGEWLTLQIVSTRSKVKWGLTSLLTAV